MTILTYILSFSLVILSVVKTTDIFILSNRSLEKLETQFVKKTKSLLKSSGNNKGNISLTASVMTLLLSLLLLFFVSKMKIEYQEALYRKESYICLRYMNRETEKYINKMAIFNLSLRTAFIASGSGIASIQSAEIFKALVILRNAYHLYYLKKITINNFCNPLETISYLKNFPFKIQTNSTLATNVDETSILRNKKWSYFFYKYPKGIRLKKSFCLKSNFTMKNEFSLDSTSSSEEIPIEDLSNLKCLPGQPL